MLKFNNFYFLYFLLISSFWMSHASLNTDYSSEKLKLLDYTQMKTLIQNRIQEAKSKLSPENPTIGVDEAVEHLKTSLNIVLMKPDLDHKGPSLILILQNEIMNYRSFDVTFRELVEKAVRNFQSSEKNLEYQVSQLYVLENSLAHLKSINNSESTKALQKIASGKLKPSKKMISYLLLNMGRGEPISPSYTAKVLLKNRSKTKKAEDMRKKAFEEKQRKLSEQKITTVKKTYRKQASQKEPKEGWSLIKSIKNWFSPQKPPAENPDNTEENKEEYFEIIKIDL